MYINVENEVESKPSKLEAPLVAAIKLLMIATYRPIPANIHACIWHVVKCPGSLVSRSQPKEV